MTKLILTLLPVLLFSPNARALDLTAPTVPAGAAAYMPERADSFAQGLWQILKAGVGVIRPDIREGAALSLGLICAVMACSLVGKLSRRAGEMGELVGVAVIGTALLDSTRSMIALGVETVQQISEYGKLLLGVMTAAMAAQGGATASTALYAGTAFVNAVLAALIPGLLIPALYAYLALALAHGAMGEEILDKAKAGIKWLCVWLLKLLLYGFTGYMTVTGAVSGTTDAAALKAAKLTISGAVPVVGSILSDASEAVLVSAAVVKNAAGVYGMLAILAICISPFLRLGVQYLIWKLTDGICSMLGSKRLSGVIGDFSAAMGLLLAMTGSECALFLISAVCFLRGVG